MKIGVLALQGAVAEHIRALEASGVEAVPIKRTEELDDLDGLVIPGGESTTIGKLMVKYGFIDAVRAFHESGRGLFGTCAGLIVLAKEIENQDQKHLQVMDITVARNAFGRQKESFETDLVVKGIDDGPLKAVFIRAPLIKSVEKNVDVLSEYNGEIVLARQGKLLACSFHPELTDDFRLHEYFVRIIKNEC